MNNSRQLLIGWSYSIADDSFIYCEHVSNGWFKMTYDGEAIYDDEFKWMRNPEGFAGTIDSKEIREAMLKRIKNIHPDKFNK